MCFPVNFAKVLRTPFFTKHLRWLLLLIESLQLNKLSLSKLSLSISLPVTIQKQPLEVFYRNRSSEKFPKIHRKMAMDSCRDGWNVRNCSSSHVQVFRDRWNVQIGDGWNVRNCLNMNFLNLVEIWIWILQNLRCLSCKSTNFVLVVKPTLMSLFWLFGLCLFGLLFAMYDW